MKEILILTKEAHDNIREVKDIQNNEKTANEIHDDEIGGDQYP